MTSYIEFYNSLYNIGSTVGGPIPVLVPGLGNHTSDRVDADVLEFKEFGFFASAGVIYTYNPNIGDGFGILSADSEALFPLVGDDRPYIIRVRVTDVTNGKFQFGLFAESAIPDGTFYIASNTYNGDPNVVDSANDDSVVLTNTAKHYTTMMTVGDVTDTPKIGSSCIYTRDLSPYFAIHNPSSAFNINVNEPFTFCFWVWLIWGSGLCYLTSASNTVGALGFIIGSGNYYNPRAINVGYGSSSNYISTSGDIVSRQWNHLAITRAANDSYTNVFLNGSRIARSSFLSSINVDTITSGYGGHELGGYLDDILFCKECLWTDEFTPPTTPVIDLLV